MSKTRRLDKINPAELPPSKRPKSGKTIAFPVTCEVPVEYWEILQKGGFKEGELGGLLASCLEDITDQLLW